jgi:hypothetical protein
VASVAPSPQKKIFGGQTFYSIQAAAEVLNRSPRTLRRLEQAGVIAKPKHQLPGGRQGQRWYSSHDLEDLRRLVAESGFGDRQVGSRGRLRDLLDALPGEARTQGRKSAWAGQEISNRPRELLHRRDQADIDPTDWVPPSERRRQAELPSDPLPPPDECPICGVEVVWVTQKPPGGGTRQVPCCELHGLVSLTQDERDLNICPGCGAELLWELREGVEGFVPACELCGPVTLPAPARVPRALGGRPFAHQISFNLPPPEAGRARGLREGDVVGAVRAPRRQDGPRINFIDPHVGPTRPS